MTVLLTAAEMRAIERAAIESGRASGLDLMERAGRGVVDAVFAEWPHLAQVPGRAVVLCGPGNNGGDGYVIARLLRAWGWEVAVFAIGAPDQMPPDAARNRARWEEMGVVSPLDAAEFEGADLIVDAIFGTGLSRGFAPPDAVGAAFHAIFANGDRGHGQAMAPKVVAVDIPSGLDADSGRVLGTNGDWVGGIGAHLTVTFHAPKLGHMLAGGPEMCGKLAIVDIGLRTEGQGVPLARLPDPLHAAPSLSKRGAGAHKYTHGHALVLSGPFARTGAARLAARAALRIGAGLVTLAAPGSAMMECAAQVTAIMLRRCDDAGALAGLLQDRRFNALCLGPGLGVDEGTRDLVGAALSTRRACVLDADALTAFADAPEALFAQIHDDVVLTPHAGEFARLFPDLAARLDAHADAGPAWSKLDATREAARRAGCTILFKGADTVISAPGGRAVVNAAAYKRAAPWLATAGAGDVLAGMIAGLQARGFSGLEAARTAAWLHVEAARAFGPGLIAEDLPEILPRVLRDLDPQAGVVSLSAEASSNPSA
jgi:hydroxyethylthiazole kinase-like uncharacterized protein yjeF